MTTRHMSFNVAFSVSSVERPSEDNCKARTARAVTLSRISRDYLELYRPELLGIVLSNIGEQYSYLGKPEESLIEYQHAFG